MTMEVVPLGGLAVATVHVRPQTDSVVTTRIGVGRPNAPFLVDAATPSTLDIYVFSTRQNGHVFRPVVEIDPRSVVLNGVRYPNAVVRAASIDRNGDGVRDAVITISPRSALGLNLNTTRLTIRGLTRHEARPAFHRWVGSATIAVVAQGVSTPSDTLLMNQSLNFSNVPGGSNLLVSNNGLFALVLQNSDGNVVLYPWNSVTNQPSGNYLWAAYDHRQNQGVGNQLIMQNDGNLVLYSATCVSIWASRTTNNPGAYATITNTGKLLVIGVNGQALFSAP